MLGKVRLGPFSHDRPHEPRHGYDRGLGDQKDQAVVYGEDELCPELESAIGSLRRSSRNGTTQRRWLNEEVGALAFGSPIEPRPMSCAARWSN